MTTDPEGWKAADDGYRSIFESSPHAILVHDSETMAVIEVNEAACNLLGRSREGLLGAEFEELRLDSEKATKAKALGDETPPPTIEWQVTTEDGGTRWVKVQLRSSTIDGTERIISYLTDITEQRERERRLEENDAILRQLTDATDDVFWLFDSDFSELQFICEAYEKVWGRPVADLREDPMDFLEGVHPEDREIVVDAIDELQSGNSTQTEYRVNPDENYERWVSVEGEPIFDESGEVVRVAGYARDITEEKARERRLKENDAILGQLTEATDDVFWLFDGDFTELLFINEAYEEVWGQSAEDLRDEPMDFLQGVHPEDREKMLDTVETLQSGTSTLMEYRVNPEEDFERWVSVRGEPIVDENGEVVRAAGYARDITDRKERERQVKALSEATQKLSLAPTPEDVADTVVEIADTVLDQHVTAIWQYDDSANRLEPWTATERVLNLAGESESEDLHSIEPGSFEMEVFQSGEPTIVEDYNDLDNSSNPDAPLGSLLLVPIGDRGQLHVGSTEPAAFGHSEKNLLSILASNADTAFERAEREDALETYKNKLERSNENLQEFAYVASHDLQEPLRSVTSYMDLLETEYGDSLDDDAQFYIDRVTSNAEQMSTLIDALLEYSRVKTDEGDFVEVETGEVLDETLARLEHLIEETGADISTGSLPTVVADRNQLSQIFQNLITNAIDHGGEPPAIDIHAEVVDDTWTFAIDDNGPGIPESQQDRVFEIFQQANTDGSGEAGIGLAICERIVTRHGGDIWVESEEEGSTFKFTLPKRTVE